MSVANQGLIQDSYVGYELFDKTNLGMSEYVQQLNYRRALEGELQRMIKSSDEIADVKVRLVIPKKAVFKEDEVSPTAAIKLRFKDRRSPERVSIDGIQNLVASSVEGLAPDKVVVTDNNGKILSAPPMEENSIIGKTSTQLEYQRQQENYFKDKVGAILDGPFGNDNYKVRLNTEINFDQLEVQKKDYDPDRKIERSEQMIKDSTTNIDTSFVPGVNWNKGQSNEIKNYEIATADSHFVKAPGAIKRLTVTAIINDKIEVVDRKGRKSIKIAKREKTELDDVEKAIKTAIGFDSSRGDQVNVISLPFMDIVADKQTEINEYNRLHSIKWYEKEDALRHILLLVAILIAALVMWRAIHAKFAKEKMRIAMGLPEKLEQPVLKKFDKTLIELPQQDIDANAKEDTIENEMLDDSNVISSDEEGYTDNTTGNAPLMERANAEEHKGTNAESIKMELRNKVTSFIVDSPDVAVKLFRVFFNQESGANA